MSRETPYPWLPVSHPRTQVFTRLISMTAVSSSLRYSCTVFIGRTFLF